MHVTEKLRTVWRPGKGSTVGTERRVSGMTGPGGRQVELGGFRAGRPLCVTPRPWERATPRLSEATECATQRAALMSTTDSGTVTCPCKFVRDDKRTACDMWTQGGSVRVGGAGGASAPAVGFAVNVKLLRKRES